MTKLLAILFSFLMLSAAHAQGTGGQLGPGQIMGNPTSQSNVPQPMSTAVFTPVGTFSDFSHDDGAAINAALSAASAAGGGWVVLNPSQPFWANTQITIPPNVALGCIAPPQKQLNGSNPSWMTLGCSVYLAPNNTIINKGTLRNAYIIQDNIHFAGKPTTTHALKAITNNFSTTGTAVKMNAYDTISEELSIVGFNLAIDDESFGRGMIRNVLMESANCVKWGQIGDYSKALNLECWPQYSAATGKQQYNIGISNIADNGSGSWRVTLSSAPTEPLVTGDEVFIGGGGSLTLPQGAQGKHTITVIDSTHVDLTGSFSAPVVTGTTTSGSAYVSGLSTLNDLWTGMTFTGSCFSGTRTVSMMLQGNGLIADANATSSGTCSMTFASQAFSATGSPQLWFDADGGQHGIGFEFAGGSLSGGLMSNFYSWCHDVGFQFDTNVLTTTIDLASVDCFPAERRRDHVGYFFQTGAYNNKVTGNSQTSGGTAVVNQGGLGGIATANVVHLGRIGAWVWGAIENQNGALSVVNSLDSDGTSTSGNFVGDVFTVQAAGRLQINASYFTGTLRTDTGLTTTAVASDGSPFNHPGVAAFPNAVFSGSVNGPFAGNMGVIGPASGCPDFSIYNQLGGANQKYWDIYNCNGSLTFRALNDAFSSSTVPLTLSPGGTNVSVSATLGVTQGITSGSNGGTQGSVAVYGATSGSSGILAQTTGGLTLYNNQGGQNTNINDGGNGTAFIIGNAGGIIANKLQVNPALTGNAPALTAVPSGDTNANLALIPKGTGKIQITGGTAPTLTAGCNGTGQAISGNDNHGTITGQTTASTSCTLTFSAAFAATPDCVVTGLSSPLTGAVTTTTSTLVVNFASTANYKWSYHCF